jgi:transaldolase/glucose-6-phosphate isomerase
MEAIELIQGHGQSVWLDHASESLRDGQFLDWIEQGWITGITSSTGLMPGSHVQGLIKNPWVRLLAHAGIPDDDILRDLLTESYREIADFLLPIFERTNGEDGYVSLDIDPRVVQDQEAILSATLNLWHEVNRPNLLISIPATTETLPVLAESLEQGINVNVTMVCSIEQYIDVVDVYLSALDKRLERGNGIEHIVSTASFPIGLIDLHVNRELQKFKGEGAGAKRAGALNDKIGLAIAKLAYAQFNLSFSSERYLNLSRRGGRVQRPLWTGLNTNQNVSSWEYVEQLIGPHTISAPKINALSELQIRDVPGPTIEEGLSEARGELQALESIGITMQQVVSDITATIFEKKGEAIVEVLDEVHGRRNILERELKPVLAQYRTILDELDEMEIPRRVWQADASLWGSDRRTIKDVSGRMGWLNLHLNESEIIQECRNCILELKENDVRKLVMVTEESVGKLITALGTNSSSDVDDLVVLDLHDPGQLQSTLGELDPKQTHYVFIVSSYQGELLRKSIQALQPLLHGSDEQAPTGLFSLITYPEVTSALGSPKDAARKVFSIPANLPFHFSALGYPGMLAAAWIGKDLKAISTGLSGAMNRCLPTTPIQWNPGLALASSVAGAVRSGVSRIVLAADSDWSPYCDWIEAFWDDAGLFEYQDVDVSLDIELERLSGKGDDGLVIFLTGSGAAESRLGRLIESGVPVKVIDLNQTDEAVGELVGLMSFSTAVLASIWKHDPFTLKA